MRSRAAGLCETENDAWQGSFRKASKFQFSEKCKQCDSNKTDNDSKIIFYAAAAYEKKNH